MKLSLEFSGYGMNLRMFLPPRPRPTEFVFLWRWRTEFGEVLRTCGQARQRVWLLLKHFSESQSERKKERKALVAQTGNKTPFRKCTLAMAPRTCAYASYLRTPAETQEKLDLSH